MNRQRILEAADKAVAQRPDNYGTPKTNFDRIARLWAAHIESLPAEGNLKTIKASDVAIMLALVKVARLQSDPTHADSWIDLAGYAACGGECAIPDDEAWREA